jgi:hypothetical protein
MTGDGIDGFSEIPSSLALEKTAMGLGRFAHDAPPARDGVAISPPVDGLLPCARNAVIVQTTTME